MWLCVVAVMSCSSDDNAPVIAFVSKMFPVDVKSLPQHRTRYCVAVFLLYRQNYSHFM